MSDKKARDEAVDIFELGYNCAQAILAAYGAPYGIERKEAYRLGAAFGGGMADAGSVCGAISGALMVIGLKNGKAGIFGGLKDIKVRCKGKKFMKLFEERKGSIICRELLRTHCEGCDESEEAEHCSGFVSEAGNILDEIL